MAQEIKRIEKEFVFKNLADEGAPVSAHYRNLRYTGVFSGFAAQKISVSFPEAKLEKVPNQITIFFRFRGTSMTAKTPVLASSDTALTLGIPERVFRDLGRSFERIQPEGYIGVSILLDGQTFKLDFPSSESYYDPTASPALSAKFDPARIAQLLRGFREKVAALSSEHKIIMFRERKQNTVIERLIAASGKTLILPFDQMRSFVNANPKHRSYLISQDDLIRLFREIGMDPMSGVNTIQAYMVKRRAQQVWHELYCPVLYKEYVVGYILLIHSDTKTGPFLPSTVDFVVQFSRLLSFSLQKNGYFKEIPVREQFDKSELLDISGSGMLFSYPLDGPSLNLFMDLDLQIHAEKREIPVKGRIMRIYRDSRSVYVGVQFMELSPNDHQFLLSFLYGPEYDGKIELADQKGDSTAGDT